MSIHARWLTKYNTARLWAAIARRRYMWKPSAKNRAELARRRRQVEYARRVLKRHPPNKPEPANGIDVSNLQGPNVDFRAVRRDGWKFVYLKAGEGDWPDPHFIRNVQAATAAGLEVGAYQFLRPRQGRTGATEASYFLRRLEEANLDKGDLRPVLDIEASQLDQSGTRAYIQSFVAAMNAHGHRPLIYTGTWFWGPRVGDGDFGCPLWIAAYQTEQPKLPAPWREYVIWQFSSSYHVAGVSGNCDVNYCPDLRKVRA